MGLIFARANEALDINPPAGDQYLSTNGSDWLWAVTAVYTLSFVSLTFPRLRLLGSLAAMGFHQSTYTWNAITGHLLGPQLQAQGR
jgi:bacteriorhodopsin